MVSGAGPPSGPEPALVSAAAMVFVADPAAPVLTQGDAHHLFDVLRLRPGEVVIAGDGCGAWSPCRVVPALGARSGAQGWRHLDPASLLAPDGPVAHQRKAAPEITVAFAPTKGDRPEWVTQKLTELGVDRIVPLRTSRSVVHWEGERGAKAVARLRRVAREAAAQCRRPRLPEVAGVGRLEDLARRNGAGFALAEAGGDPPTLDRPVLAVGPEGGWDPDELAAFGPGIGLGATVLRAETAAVVAGALLCGLRSGVVLPLA